MTRDKKRKLSTLQVLIHSHMDTSVCRLTGTHISEQGYIVYVMILCKDEL